MPVASDDVVWLDVLPSMGRFRQELETQAGTGADTAGKKAGGAFTGAFGKALKIGAVVGGALAVAAAGNFMKGAIREASDLGESLNAVQVTFGDAAGGINELGKAAATSVGLSQAQFNGLAVQFSAFAQNIAGEGGDVVGVMRDLTTRGADFASVMNLDVNEAMSTFQSGLAGETEPLRKYGIDLSAAAVENYALANGIIKAGEEMTEAQKVQARYGSLMEQTSKVQGDFTNTSDSLANSQRILGARWDDIQAKVGSKVLPTLEKFSGWVLNTGLPALQQFGGWAQENLLPIFRNIGDFLSDTVLPKLRDLADTVLPVVVGAFQAVGDAISSVVGFFREHDTALNILKGTVAFVGGLMVAAWVTQATVSAINSVKAIGAWFATATASTTSATIQSRSTAQIVVGWIAAAAGATLNAAKIVAAWALSVAQTGVLMAMYATQSVTAAARSAAAWVAAQIRTVASLVATGAAFIAQGAVMAASMAGTAARVVAGWLLMGAQSLLAAAKMAAAWVLAMGPVGWVIAAVVGLVALIIANWDTVKRWTIDIWNAVVGFIKDAASAIWSWVTEKFNALKDGVSAIFTAVRDVVLGIWNGFRDAVVDGAQAIWDWVVDKFTSLKDGAVGIFQGIRDTISEIWDGLVDAVKKPIRIVFGFVNDKMIDPINWLLDKFPGDLRISKLPMGFMNGGYTGDGRKTEPKGIVHAGEYVFTQDQVKRIGLPRIEAIANGAIPAKGEIQGATRSREIGGPLDWARSAWDATGGRVVSGIADLGEWALDKIAKGAKAFARTILDPLADSAKRMTPNNVIGNTVDGMIDKLMGGVFGKAEEQDRVQDAARSSGNFSGVPAGDGTLGSNFRSLFATIKAIVPQARLNSGQRNTRDAHGRGKAVDFGFGTGPGGAGSAGLALIKRVLHDRFGKNLYELIYSGVGNDRPNLKNSRPLAYSAAIQRQHRNHVHAAVYDRGGLWEPGTAGFNFTGGVERVLTPKQDDYFRKFVDITRYDHPGSGSLIDTVNVAVKDNDTASGVVDELFHRVSVIKRGGKHP